MENEPDLKIREKLLLIFNSKKFEELLEQISNLQKSFPNSIFLLNLLGNINNKLQNYSEAIINFEKIIKINPMFSDAYYNLGIIFKNINEIEKSIYNYKKCIQINRNKYEASNNLANIYQNKQNTKLAINMYLQCLEIKPDYLIALQNFGVCLQNFKFSEQSLVIEKHLINLLEHNKILRPVDIINSLVSYLYLNQKFNSMIKSINNKKISLSLDELINEFLNTAILMQLLKITPITDIQIEKALKYIRYEILLNISSINNKENASKFMGLIASQCFINEYLYPIKIEEEKILKKLEEKINNNLEENNFKKLKLEITCLAAYKSLRLYNWSYKLKNIDGISYLFKQQISDSKIEIDIKKNLDSKIIQNPVSLKVKAQYENNPYPRWQKIALINSPQKPINYFNNLNLNINEEKIKNWNNINVLVAGCGTGQHAITTATKYRNSLITAIDLSSSSLSYAKRKANELEIKNINFVQMDLLDLKNYGKSFDIIEAVGVLHHMAHPYKGWEVLYEILNLEGLMMIGVYSKIAREHIQKLRSEIKNQKIKFNKKNIINFREKIIFENDDDYKLIKQSPDFYSFSNLVDLLFHVQEHTFTIPEIKSYISKLNLKFCGFENKTLVNYFNETHENSDDLCNLDLWNKFEINNPRVFAGMYQFWCQKI